MKEPNTLEPTWGSLMPCDQLLRKSVRRSEANREVARRYSFLASGSAANGWKRATFEFTVRLCWAELFRCSAAKVVYDSRDGMVGVSQRSVFD